MFRKDFINLLRNNSMSVRQIARTVGESPGDVADHLEHLLRSLKHTGSNGAPSELRTSLRGQPWWNSSRCDE
jgi:predicted Zn-ribbon and HTH transcriptional regulator